MANIVLLPDPCLLELVQVEVNDQLKLITASATTTASEAACPLCHQASQRVHSRYHRTLTDLPCCGRRAKWIVQVRCFRCLNPSCKRKLFTERLPTCAPAYARRTVHQGEVLSEDRAGAYAEGANKGAPEAVQIADSFHLLLNVGAAVTRLFERKHESLKHIYEQEVAADPPLPPLPIEKEFSPKPLTFTQKQQQARQARRNNRYQEVKALHEQGVSQRAIAALVGLHRDTVHRYLNTSELPAIVRPHRRSKLDPYKDYLHQRWSEGMRNVTHLVAELRAQGYRGSDTIVFDYLRPLHEQPEWLEAYQQQQRRAAQGLPTTPLSAREAAWLFVCPPPKLTLAQVRQLGPLRTRDEELGKAYELIQDFRTMVTQRQLPFLTAPD